MKRYLIVLFSLTLILNISYAQFKYENTIYVKNNTSTALTNAQVLIRFNTLSPVVWGWMQADGKDIVFTTSCGGTNYLTHWIESYLLTDSTKIWVKVPYIGANDSTQIFLNYGNPNAANLSTLNVFEGPWSSTDSVVLTSNNVSTNHQYGFRFSTNTDILITHFGKRVYDSTQRYLTLFDYNTQAIIAQLLVSPGHPQQYNYNSLATPVWLSANQQYIMCIFSGMSEYYYYGNSTQIGPYLTYIDMKHMLFCSQNTFPTISIPNMHYGNPDFLYYAKQYVSPAPTFRTLPTADTVTPAAPQNLTTTLGAFQASLKWKKNTEFDIAYYRVYRNTENNPTTATLIGTVNQPDTTFLATGLTSGTTYFFWVTAIDRYCVPRVSPYSNLAVCVPGNATYNLPELIYYKFSDNTYSPKTTRNFASTPVGAFYAPVLGHSLGSGGEFDSCVVGIGTNGAIVNTGWQWNLGANPWTISFWVKDLAGSANQYMLGDNWADQIRCFYESSTSSMRFRISTNDFSVPCPMPGSYIFHFVYTGSQLLTYRDGVFIGSQAIILNMPLGLGFNVAGYIDLYSSLNGKMDEFRLYNRALSQAEITATWNHELPITLQIPAPVTPILISPPNNSTMYATAFSWHSIANALNYTLQVSTNPDFSSFVINAPNLTDTVYSIPFGLLNVNTTYYWRVNASNQGGTSPWSSVWSFFMQQYLPVNLKVYLEGFWNGTTQVQDTVRAYLAQTTSPYNLIDSTNVIPNSSGIAGIIFTKANNGNYYLVVKHRNHLETWSMLPQALSTAVPVNYDFTTDSTKAYGFNMKKIGSYWVLYGADPNQDGSIDANDIAIFIAQYGTQGYLSCDFNGDNDVNATDVQIVTLNYGLTVSKPGIINSPRIKRNTLNNLINKNRGN